MPLSYYNAVGAELEEKYDPSDQDKARIVLGGGGGSVNNNTFCFPIVVRSHLPPGVKAQMLNILENILLVTNITEFKSLSEMLKVIFFI